MISDRSPLVSFSALMHGAIAFGASVIAGLGSAKEKPSITIRVSLDISFAKDGSTHTVTVFPDESGVWAAVMGGSEVQPYDVVHGALRHFQRRAIGAGVKAARQKEKKDE